MPKTPEEWLEQTAPEKKAGLFKLILGYAPGVGKTYNMLSEAIRRHRRGEDVVIGIIETHGRKGITDLVGELEVIPRRKLDYKESDDPEHYWHSGTRDCSRLGTAARR